MFLSGLTTPESPESMKTRELVAAARMGDNYGAYHKAYEVSDKSALMALRKLDICIA
jgi:hypothetical protein